MSQKSNEATCVLSKIRLGGQECGSHRYNIAMFATMFTWCVRFDGVVNAERVRGTLTRVPMGVES